MKAIRTKLLKIKPEWALRVGLGCMYLYSGVGLLRAPSSWYGFAPVWVVDIWERIAPFDVFLRIQGAVELVIAALLLCWFLGRWGLRIGAVLATGEFAFILIFAGVDLVTFRDIGLLGATLALLVLSFSRGENQRRAVDGGYS